MTLTLEERERIAYIENRPEAKLLGEMMAAEFAEHDELRHEIDSQKGEIRSLENRNDELEQDIGKAEDREQRLNAEIDDLRNQVGDLQSQIHEAGIDLL